MVDAPEEYGDDTFDVEPTKTKRFWKKRAKALEGDIERMQAAVQQERQSRVNAQAAEREANQRRARAELQLRNIKASVQTLVNFANDEPPPPGRFYIDPVNGEVSLIAVGSNEKATR